jgi:hypothetical protein
MILKRIVKPFGNGRTGHIILPGAEFNNLEVYIVSEKEALDLKELIEKTLLLRKVDIFDRAEHSKDYENFKLEVRSRLAALELVYRKN